MKPSQVAYALRRIATKIDRSRQPDPRLVSRDLRRVLAGMSNPRVSSDLSLVQMGISYKPGVSKEDAIQRAKSMIHSEGGQTGNWVEDDAFEDTDGTHLVGMMETDEQFWNQHSEDGWSSSDGDVTITIEVP